MDQVHLPDTDSPEVMQQVISYRLTQMIWAELERTVAADQWEAQLLETYGRVYRTVAQAHLAK